MGQSTERVRVTLWVSVEADAALRREAGERGLTVSEIYRRVLSMGWQQYGKTTERQE